jgi:NitT/TauT family transport system substrate-binding protein
MRLGHARRASSGIAVGLAVVLLGTACSAGSSTGPAAATSVVVVGALPIADTVGFYVAVREGFFRQAGLNVSVKPVLQSTSAIPDMETGKVDIIAGANYISYFQAEAKDPGSPPFALLAEGTTCAPNAFDILALPSSGITDPADLAGKTIAVNLPDNVQTLTIDTVLRDDAVNPASVRYVTIPFPKMLTALKAHRVDAISVVEPFLTGAELALGAEPVLDECTGPTASFPLSGYFSTRAWAQQHPAAVRAFQQALAQGQAVADTDRGLVEKTLTSYIPGLSPAVAAVITLNQFPTSLDPIRLQRAADLMYTGGMLRRPLDVRSFLAP